MRARAVLAACILLAVTAPAAGAATAAVGFFGPQYSGDGDEVNNVTVSVGVVNTIRFAQTNTALTIGSGCASALGGTAADCEFQGAKAFVAALGGGADVLNATSDYSFPGIMVGEAGDDKLTGSGDDDYLGGGTGDDTTDGGSGDDRIDDATNLLSGTSPSDGNDVEKGGAGDDTIVARAGADTIDGGADVDTLDYSARTAALNVSVNAGAVNDGQSGEGDTVTNVERLLSGSGPDVLVAGAAASQLYGAAGDDVLTGGAAGDLLSGTDVGGAAGSGNDTLDGAGGADELRGGDGVDTSTYASRSAAVVVTLDDVADDGEAGEKDNVRSDVENVTGGAGGDALTGSAGANALTGNAGDDVLDGAGGADVLRAGDGNDAVQARDGATDDIACGAGDDTVVADAFDTIAADCEHVDAPAAGGGTTGTGPGPGTGSPTPPAALTLAPGAAKIDARGRVAVLATCSAGAGGCAGALTLRTVARKRRPAIRAATAATASYIVPAGSARTLRLKLSAGARRILRRDKRLALRASARAVIGNAPAAPLALTVRARTGSR